MDTFVKGENEMCKMSAKEHVQTRIELDFRHQLSVCPATHTEYVQAKRNPP